MRIHQLTVTTPFQIGAVHIYLIEDQALSLIDAGVNTEEAWQDLKSQLRSLNYRPEDIQQIFLTHHHPDHIGLVEKFPEAKIFGHKYVDYWLRRDQEFLNGYKEYYEDFLSRAGLPKGFQSRAGELEALLHFSGRGKLDFTLKEGDSLSGHEDWQVIETFGHAQSHLSFYNEKAGLFIAGDHLLLNQSPNPIIEAPYKDQKERQKPLLQYRSNLKKCLHLSIKDVLPGHGKTFSDVDQYVKRQLKEQEKRASYVLKLLGKESLTAFDLTRRLFPRHYKSQLELTLSETIGQLDYLLDLGNVTKEMIDGTIYYRAG